MTTLKDSRTVREYSSVLETLEKGSFWSREWAARQYLGVVITGMCLSVVDDEHDARRYAVARVLEVFLEHRHNLTPAVGSDLERPRHRVATIAIPNCEEQCEPWLDVLEYMQLENWSRKGIHSDVERANELRQKIGDKFSSEVLAEIDANTQGWWLR